MMQGFGAILIPASFGIGALASIPCGWIGDRYSPKLVLSGSLFKYRHSPGFAVTDSPAFASWLRAG